MKQRNSKRNDVWEDTRATVMYYDRVDMMSRQKMQCGVDNLGTTGIFLITRTPPPVGEKLDITIDFQPDAKNGIAIPAQGVVAHINDKGCGVMFTEIDTEQLSDSIMKMFRIKWA